jgi:hypothetical protein
VAREAAGTMTLGACAANSNPGSMIDFSIGSGAAYK